MDFLFDDIDFTKFDFDKAIQEMKTQSDSQIDNDIEIEPPIGLTNDTMSVDSLRKSMDSFSKKPLHNKIANIFKPYTKKDDVIHIKRTKQQLKCKFAECKSKMIRNGFCKLHVLRLFPRFRCKKTGCKNMTSLRVDGTLCIAHLNQQRLHEKKERITRQLNELDARRALIEYHEATFDTNYNSEDDHKYDYLDDSILCAQHLNDE